MKNKSPLNLKRLLFLAIAIVIIGGLFHLSMSAGTEQRQMKRLIEAKEGKQCKVIAFVTDSTVTYGDEVDNKMKMLEGFIKQYKEDIQYYEAERPAVDSSTITSVYDYIYEDMKKDIIRYEESLEKLKTLKEDKRLCSIKTYHINRMFYELPDNDTIQTCIGYYNVNENKYTKLKRGDKPWEVYSTSSSIPEFIWQTDSTDTN